MLSSHTHSTATIDREMLFPVSFHFSEEEKPKRPKYFVRNTGASFGAPFEAAIESRITHGFADTQRFTLYSHNEEDILNWLAIESGITQAFAETQRQRLDFPTYSEDDILDWGVAIEVPPPRPSGTIRVKLKYKGRSKPIPIEDPWE